MVAKNQTIDLHVHSMFSDGRMTPDELAARAVRNNVTALAITDHDTMAGCPEKRAACEKHGVIWVPGVELSCELDGREAHILSLFANPDSGVVDRVAQLSACREDRMAAMLEKLAALGIVLALSDLPVADNGVYGRPHLARAMVERGYVKSVNEAFARYLYDGGPVHITKTRLTVADGVTLAKDLGGVAVLAHPGVSGWLGDLDRFVAMGIEGIEVHHPKHGGETVAKVLRYCRDHNLLASGGSDFHSPGDSPDIGSARVPEDLLEPLRERAAGRKG